MHLFSLHYLPQVKYISALLTADKVCFEMEEHFQRQTYRNRCEIYTADGLHKLIVPIDHSFGKNEKRKMKDVRIAYTDNWAVQHKRTIQSAYRSSSYYEYFEDDFIRLFDKKYEFLIDLNLASIELIVGFLKRPSTFNHTTEFFATPENTTDQREVFTTNDYKLGFDYYQVFQSKKGFIGNLSCIDLLFNVGPTMMLEMLKT